MFIKLVLGKSEIVFPFDLKYLFIFFAALISGYLTLFYCLAVYFFLFLYSLIYFRATIDVYPFVLAILGDNIDYFDFWFLF